jgi:hypothetical protein
MGRGIPPKTHQPPPLHPKPLHHPGQRCPDINIMLGLQPRVSAPVHPRGLVAFTIQDAGLSSVQILQQIPMPAQNIIDPLVCLDAFRRAFSVLR